MRPLAAIAALRSSRRAADVVGVAVVVAFALAYLSPALTSGPSFGPADLGRGLSVLTSAPGTIVHNNINGDIIDQSVAWNTLNYSLVHHGQFPFWNVDAGNGLPEFLNFESSVLALPTLVGYLVPLAWSFTIVVLVKLLIAGLGTYWFARLVRLTPLSATLAGVIFMLSGSFSNWLGWSISGVDCWIGVIMAGIVLCGRRARAGPLVLAVAVAFAIYGGFPEGYVLLAASIVLALAIVQIAVVLAGGRWRLGSAARIGAGTALGLAMSAPLWLPGIAVIRQSIRATAYAAGGLPFHGILLAIAQGYDGLPTHGSAFFLAGTNYYESAAYVGVVALVLAGVAIGTRAIAPGRRHPVVVAFAVVAVVQVLVIYRLGVDDPIPRIVRAIGLGSVSTHRLLPLLAFSVALLAAFGLAELRRASVARDASMLAALALVGLALAYMWHTVSLAAATSCAAPGALAPATCDAIRRASVVGPTAVAAGLLVLLFVLRLRRLPSRVHTGVATALVAIEGATLLFAGVMVNTYSRVNYPVTQAVRSLASVVGNSLVAQDGQNVACPTPPATACGVRMPTGIDFYPNINVGYGVDELGMHDPIIPKRSFASWPVPNAGQLLSTTNLFNPSVNTLALARAYGVSYVLVPTHLPTPKGFVHVANVDNHGARLGIYAVPKSAKVTASGAKATYHDVGDRRVEVALSGAGPATVTAHITDSPGWRASVDGQPLTVRRGPTNDLVVRVPAADLTRGRAQLVLRYEPPGLLAAFWIAVAAALLALASAVRWRPRGARQQVGSVRR